MATAKERAEAEGLREHALRLAERYQLRAVAVDDAGVPVEDAPTDAIVAALARKGLWVDEAEGE